MTSFFGVPVDVVYRLVSGFTGALTPILGGAAAVAAIIAFTVAVRVVLMPLSFRAMRGQAVQARLAPQLQALRTRYARQPERLQREMAALYKREGTSIFAGVTPLLLQWPLLSVVYLLFRSARVGGKPNTLLSHDLLGVPLGTHWLSGAGPASLQGLVFVGVLALLAGLCWLSGRLGRLMAASQAADVPALPAAGKVMPRRDTPGHGTPGRAASGQGTSGQGTSGRAAPGKGTHGRAAPGKGTPGKGTSGQGTSGQGAPGRSRGPARAGGSARSGTPAGTRSAGSAGSAGGAVPGVPAGSPGWLVRVLPYLTVVIAAFAPLAAGVYLVTSTAWSLAERRLFWRSRSRASHSAAAG